MQRLSQKFITWGELLCFLAVWTIGLVVVFADHGRSTLSQRDDVASTNIGQEHHLTLE